jgi:hypothetical protein
MLPALSKMDHVPVIMPRMTAYLLCIERRMEEVQKVLSFKMSYTVVRTVEDGSWHFSD